jgi:hypothetical protein
MRVSRTYIAAIIVVIVAIAGISYWYFTSSMQAIPENIKIGVVASLTGEAAAIGVFRRSRPYKRFQAFIF